MSLFNTVRLYGDEHGNYIRIYFVADTSSLWGICTLNELLREKDEGAASRDFILHQIDPSSDQVIRYQGWIVNMIAYKPYPSPMSTSRCRVEFGEDYNTINLFTIGHSSGDLANTDKNIVLRDLDMRSGYST